MNQTVSTAENRYKTNEITFASEQERRQGKLLRQLQMTISRILDGSAQVDEEFYDLLWDTICAFQNVPFFCKGSESYTYVVHDDELELKGLNKVFCRNALNYSADKALFLRQHQSHVDRPERLGTIGASYIYPLFEKLGICTETTSAEPVFIGCRATV